MNPLIVITAALFVSSLLLTWISLLFLLKSPVALYFSDKPDHRKVHFLPIPRLGGVVIISSFILISSIFIANKNVHQFFSIVPVDVLITIGIASVVILLLGFFDDSIFIKVRVRHKLAAQVVIAFTAVYLFNVNIGKLSFFGFLEFPNWFGNIISVVWIIGLSNAFNLIDGLDGLAGSISLLAIVTLGIIAAIGHQVFLVVLCSILAGSIIGFLILNSAPAKTFMGDTGSLFLGCIVALLSLHLGKTCIPERAIITMPLVAGIPILEVFISMVRRYFRAKDNNKKHAGRLHSMVIPDNSHIHHRLMYKGYSPLQSTILLSSLAFILNCGALCSIMLSDIFLPLLFIYLIIPVVLFLNKLGFGGRFKRALGLSKSRYNGYIRPTMIGMLDNSGTLAQLFSESKTNAFNCIPVTEEEISTLGSHLHSAVVLEESEKLVTLKKAENISSIISRPVFVIDPTDVNNLNIRKVCRNGSTVVHEKTATMKDLFKDLKYVSLSRKIKHSEKVTF